MAAQARAGPSRPVALVAAALDEFGLAHRPQSLRTVGAVVLAALQVDRRHDAVPARQVLREVVEQVAPPGSIEQVVVRVDDRQVGFEDGLAPAQQPLAVRGRVERLGLGPGSIGAHGDSWCAHHAAVRPAVLSHRPCARPRPRRAATGTCAAGDNPRMAAGSLLALLDDIASVLDDVAILGKVAARKTVGVLGDDLALNAQQVAGVTAARELPVVWAVAKGSFVNKAILVPAALTISAFAPWAVTPLLMVGGAFLCYEGFEKLAHRWMRPRAEVQAQRVALRHALADPGVDLAAFEREKIKGAVRTDFILSAEIVAITLGIVAASPLVTQVSVLGSVAVAMTIGVYGLVGGIVKIDDAGLALARREGAFARGSGALILKAAPFIMKGLSVAGTAAMFLVGGGILAHGIAPLRGAVERLSAGPGGIAHALLPLLVDGLLGLVAGALALAAVVLGKRLFARARATQ
jgi:hypothetical protein